MDVGPRSASLRVDEIKLWLNLNQSLVIVCTQTKGVLASTGFTLFYIHVIPTLDANGTLDQRQLMQFFVAAPRVSSIHPALLFRGCWTSSARDLHDLQTPFRPFLN